MFGLWPRRAKAAETLPPVVTGGDGAPVARAAGDGWATEGARKSGLAALREQRATARRVVRREEMARLVVDWLRREGYTGWLMPADFDEAQDEVCKAGGLVAVHSQLLREAVLSVPGVRKSRPRLKGDPQFDGVRTRLRALGLGDDRAWLYHVAELEPGADVGGRSEPAAAPQPGRTPGTMPRAHAGLAPGLAQAPAPPAGKYRRLGDVRAPASDDLVLGTEIDTAEIRARTPVAPKAWATEGARKKRAA